MAVPQNAWNFLHSTFGGGPACSRLYECSYCKEELGTVTNLRLSKIAIFGQFETDIFRDFLFSLKKAIVFFHKSVLYL